MCSCHFIYVLRYSVHEKNYVSINKDKKWGNIYGWLLESENWTIKKTERMQYPPMLGSLLLNVDFYAIVVSIIGHHLKKEKNDEEHKMATNWVLSAIDNIIKFSFFFLHIGGEFLFLIIILILELHAQFKRAIDLILGVHAR